MATRKIKDAKDLSTNEFIFFKGHARATFMSDGRSVEDAINNISVGGGENIISARIDNIGGENLINIVDVPMQPNAVYVAESIVNGIQLISLATPKDLYAEYSLHFTTDANKIGVFAFPENLIWANGEIPTVEAGKSYELLIVATKLADEYIYKAVLTPFTAV